MNCCSAAAAAAADDDDDAAAAAAARQSTSPAGFNFSHFELWFAAQFVLSSASHIDMFQAYAASQQHRDNQLCGGPSCC
jgi:hypothetical protein